MIYFLISGAIFAADLIIKGYAEKLPYNEPKKALKDRIIIRKVHNKGGALNSLDSNQQFVAGFSSALTFTVIIAQLYLLGRKGFRCLKLAFSFLIGGGLSNAYDRIVRKYVVDYFSFNVSLKKLKDIVFNISDIFIFIGTFMAVMHSLLNDKERK